MEMRTGHMISAVISALGFFVAASSSTSATIVYSGLQDLTIAHGSNERFIFVFAEAPGVFNVNDSRGEFLAASEQGELYSTVPRVDRYIPAFEVGEAIQSSIEWGGLWVVLWPFMIRRFLVLARAISSTGPTVTFQSAPPSMTTNISGG